MKKRSYLLMAILLLLISFTYACGKEEVEQITIPDTIVEETPSAEEVPVPEEPKEEPIEKPVEEEIPVYPYWWDLHDYNNDQPVLTPDGEIKNLSIQPGNQPDELYITWFSRSSSKGKVVFESEGFFSTITANATTEPSISVPNYYRNSALIQGLESNTTYTYHVGNGGSKSPDYTYITGDLYSTDFTFTIAGDPQLGHGDQEDLPSQRNVWRLALNRMKEQIPESDFLLTTGDQVAKADSSEHYDYFLDNSVLYSTPLVPVVGNHDVGSGYFGDHFSLPNQSALGTSQGRDGDYWFIKGDVLFMVLNTLTVMERDIHEQFVAETVAANPNTKWRVLVSHYSPVTVLEKYQSDREEIRYSFAFMADYYDIDLIISGHDHIYTRSYFLDHDADPLPDQELEYEFHNPEHAIFTIYGTSTGTLLREPDDDYPWSAISIQNWTPQLSVAHVTENSLTVTTYDADSWTQLDSFTIYKD